MKKRDLSKPQQWLIERCQRVNFGSVNFRVRGGEPDLSQPHRVTRTLKLSSSANGPRPESSLDDFELRQEHSAMLSALARLPDGTCVTIKVTHGLPTSTIDIVEDEQAA